jgi:chromosome segregation ATPase
MRNLKKLSLALMLTTLFSISFTSCIDTNVDPAVEAIYAAQADLIAAQTAVQNAEADYLAAQAAAEQADADYRAAQTAMLEVQTAGLEADNAYEAAQREQYLLQLVAQTNLQVEQSQNALALAQVQFQIDMAELMAELEAAGLDLAVQYANDYTNAMNQANSLYSQLLGAQNDLANAQLMQTGGVSYAYWLAMLQGNVTNAMAAKAAIEGAIADLEAYIANPTTPEAMVSDLNAQIDALQAQQDAMAITMQEQSNVIDTLFEENDVRTDLTDQVYDTLDDHNDAVADKNDRLGWIEDAQDDIDDWQSQLDNYAAAEAALQAVVDAAQTAFDDAEAAYDAADAASDAADAAAAAALIVRDDLVAALALLDASYQAAIADLAAEQALYDAGLTGAQAAVTTAQANYDAQVAAILVAQNDYDAKKAAFEADYAGFVWEAGADGALGIHPDATTVTDSYYVVNATNDGVDALTLTIGTGTDQTGAYATYAAFLADATAGALATDDFYNVGADDVAGGTNADRLDAALVELTTQEDLLPALAAALEDAQDDLDNFGDDLAAAEEAYLAQKALYEDGEADLEAAELALTAANDAAADAQDVEDAADDAVDDAQDALDDAEADLAAFQATTEADLQDWIDDANADIAEWNAEIDAIQPLIDAYYAAVAGMFADLDEAGVEYTFEVDADGMGVLEITNLGFLTPEDPDIAAQLIAEWQTYWEMGQASDALAFEIGLLEDLVDAYNTGDLDDLADDLADLQGDLEDAMENIELAEQALASGQVEADAATALIGYYQSLVDTLTARHANQLAIADEYQALMLAALGN